MIGGAKMKIVDEREKRGLSQLEAAKGIGISKSMLAMIETGKRSGTDTTKQKIASFYGKTVGFLFFGDNITQRDKKEETVNE